MKISSILILSLAFSSTVSKSMNASELISDVQKQHVRGLGSAIPRGDALLKQLQVKARTVPEPSSLLLMGSGLIGLAAVVRRKFAR